MIRGVIELRDSATQPLFRCGSYTLNADNTLNGFLDTQAHPRLDFGGCGTQIGNSNGYSRHLNFRELLAVHARYAQETRGNQYEHEQIRGDRIIHEPGNDPLHNVTRPVARAPLPCRQ